MNNYKVFIEEQEDHSILKRVQTYTIDGQVIRIYKFNRIYKKERILSFDGILEKFQKRMQRKNKTIAYLDKHQTESLIEYTKKNKKIFSARIFILNQEFVNKSENAIIFGFTRYSDMTISKHSFLYNSSKDLPMAGYLACIIQ